MTIFLLTGIVLVGAAVALAGRALVFPRNRAAETLDTIDSYGYTASAETDASSGSLHGALGGLAGAFGGLAGRVSRRIDEDELRRQLMSAGLYKTNPRDFLGYRVISTIGVPLFCAWIFASAGLPQIVVVGGLALSIIVGWRAPATWLRMRASRRFGEIDRELPELIDLLVVTVEAGLGFSRSMQVASERIEGPLGDELRLALQEQSMGLSTLEALRNMLGRSDTPAMRSFVRSVVQGEALGVSIGQIMRSLAVEMRTRRRQQAEERAQKAPVKLLFPLIFLIFPAMFVVLLGPAAYAFLAAFGDK
jgi:tight adherence protein C